MKISRRWLEAFLRQPLDAKDVAARLGMLGAPVDAIESIGADLTPFVVALVTDVRPHPNADKLRVTTVDDGSGTIFQVVCGAPNVTAGHKYPFARLGTVNHTVFAIGMNGLARPSGGECAGCTALPVVALPPDLGDLNRAVGLCERTERSPRFDGLQLLGVANQHDLRACVTRCRQHPLHLARPGQARLVDD